MIGGMGMNLWLGISVASFLALLWVALRVRVRTARVQKTEPTQSVSHTELQPVPARQELACVAPQVDRVVVRSGIDDVLTIRSIHTKDLDSVFNNVQRIDNPYLTRALSPVLQAIPTLSLAHQMGTRNLMEVVINGDLIRASDGNGWRALAIGNGGIQEHARLHEVSALQSLASGAVLWQIASVLVAQKHLADIHKALKRLEQRVGRIQQFLEQQRSACIASALRYIRDALRAAEQGEFLPRTRDLIEKIDHDLNGIQLHLQLQVEALLAQPVERSSWRSNTAYESTKVKIEDISKTMAELGFCLDVRLACWYTASLYRDGGRILEHRIDGIRQDVQHLAKFRNEMCKVISSDLKQIDGFWNSQATLDERQKDAGSMLAKASKQAVDANLKRLKTVQQVDAIIEESRSQTRLVLDVRDGAIAGVYASQGAAAT